MNGNRVESKSQIDYIMHPIKECYGYSTYLHREDGPARIRRYIGIEEWMQHSVYHREDGPAVIMDNGDEYWYRNGKLHREWGPAMIKTDRPVYYSYGIKRKRKEDEPEI